MKEKSTNPLLPDFWRQAWDTARENSKSEKRRIRSSREIMEYWNRFAAKYDQVHTPSKQNKRVQTILDLLEREQFLAGDTKILDIGCGTGTYSLLLAEMCQSVTALDGADEMCRQLEKKVEQHNIGNVSVVNRMWEDIDIEAEGLLGRYDLAFASMTPAVFNFDTLNKMNLVSRKNCCLVFWAEDGVNQARKDLWKEIFDEVDSGDDIATIIYPFNLLYSMGYFPRIQYIDTQWSCTETVEEAVESLCGMFWLYTEITPRIKEIVTRYVRERAGDNVFHRKTEARLGVVTWTVDGEQPAKKSCLANGSMCVSELI